MALVGALNSCQVCGLVLRWEAHSDFRGKSNAELGFWNSTWVQILMSPLSSWPGHLASLRLNLLVYKTEIIVLTQ